MNAPTYTVQSGWTDRNGKHWLYLKGISAPIPSDKAWPEGTALRIVAGRAVK